jgi:hypothetical protein
MKLWIGVLVSLLVATACLVACGDSDEGSSVRNLTLPDSSKSVKLKGKGIVPSDIQLDAGKLSDPMCEFRERFAEALSEMEKKSDRKTHLCDGGALPGTYITASRTIEDWGRVGKQPLRCVMTVLIETPEMRAVQQSVEELQELAIEVLATRDCCPTRIETLIGDPDFRQDSLTTEFFVGDGLEPRSMPFEEYSCNDLRSGGAAGDPPAFDPRVGELCRTPHGYAFVNSCRSSNFDPA